MPIEEFPFILILLTGLFFNTYNMTDFIRKEKYSIKINIF